MFGYKKLDTFSYAQIRKGLETGDRVACLGSGLLSLLIRGFSLIGNRAPIIPSHSGRIVVLNKFAAEKLNIPDYDDKWRVYICHSTRFFGEEADRDNGVQLTRFSTFLKEYPGKVYIRKLLFERDQEYLEKEFVFIRDGLDVLYEKMNFTGFLHLFNSAYDGALGGSIGDSSRRFCSEEDALNLQCHGFLPSWPPADEYTPVDLVGHLPLQRGRWGDLYRVKVSR